VKLFPATPYSPSHQTPIDIVLDRLPSKPVRSAGGHTAKCPAHNDRNPSLTIGTGRDGRVLIRCWAGCSTESVLQALGLTWQDLFDKKSNGKWSSDAR
jgi:hypothetical protein